MSICDHGFSSNHQLERWRNKSKEIEVKEDEESKRKTTLKCILMDLILIHSMESTMIVSSSNNIH